MQQRVSRNVKVLSISMILSSALIAGGIAYAAGDSIVACVNKSTGLTRIISGTMKCYKKERQVTWNQTGPSGSQGATGATGATGSSGTSNFLKNTAVNANVGIAPGANQNIMSAVVPAGKFGFSFNSQVGFDNNNVLTSRPRYAACFFSTISNATTALTTSSGYLWPVAGSVAVFRVGFDANSANSNGDFLDTKTFSANGVFDFASSTTVYFHCSHEVSGGSSDSGQRIYFSYTQLTLTAVDQITNLS